jgi:hypothetical protein
MSRPVLFALIAAATLSACGGKWVGPPAQPAMTEKFSDSVGFTGIGFENL